MSGMLTHIMEPGSSFKLIPFVRVIAFCLICICLSLAYHDIARIHMFVMCGLALGLLASVQWLMHLIKEGEGERGEGEGAASNKGEAKTQQLKSD